MPLQWLDFVCKYESAAWQCARNMNKTFKIEDKLKIKTKKHWKNYFCEFVIFNCFMQKLISPFWRIKWIICKNYKVVITFFRVEGCLFFPQQVPIVKCIYPSYHLRAVSHRTTPTQWSMLQSLFGTKYRFVSQIERTNLLNSIFFNKYKFINSCKWLKYDTLVVILF